MLEFLNTIAKDTGKHKVSELMPYLKFIAVEHNLKLNNLRAFLKAKRMLMQSIERN